ncbi:hypothetical protein ACSBR1_011733 [Camellia fascicularis]
MDSRTPNPSSLSKQKSDDFAPDDDDNSVEEEDENYASEFGISSEKGGLNKKNKKKKKKVKVGFDGGSGKKRGGGGGGLLLSPPRCQAERCEANLTEAKRYYRRHKVCELHAKATAAIVAGLRQRFCQQCSRFHELSEFDDTKRSCRGRLAGHNERRRKSSSESPHGGGEGCSRQRLGSELNENHCSWQEDDRGRTLIAFPGNPTYKQFHIK